MSISLQRRKRGCSLKNLAWGLLERHADYVFWTVGRAVTHQNGAVEIQPWQAHVDPSIDRHGVRQLQFESTVGGVHAGAMILPLKPSPIRPTHLNRRDQRVPRMPAEIDVRSHFDRMPVYTRPPTLTSVMNRLPH